MVYWVERRTGYDGTSDMVARVYRVDILHGHCIGRDWCFMFIPDICILELL